MTTCPHHGQCAYRIGDPDRCDTCHARWETIDRAIRTGAPLAAAHRCETPAAYHSEGRTRAECEALAIAATGRRTAENRGESAHG